MSDNVTKMHPSGKKGMGQRWMLLAGIVLAAAIVAALYFFRDTDDANASGETVSAGTVEDAFSFDAHSGNQYANVNGGLAIASVSGLNVYNADGTERTVLQSAMTTPNIQSAGDLALAYDAGGYSLLTAGKGSGAKLNVTTAKPLLDADLSPDGYICYSTSESGYKSVLYVCNPSGTTVYRWLSSSQYLPTCTVSKGGAYLAAVALGQENGIFESRLVVFRTDSEEIYSSITLGNELFYDLEFLDGDILCAVGESSCMWLKMDGTLLGRYSYGGAYLKDFDFGGNGFLTLSLNMYKAGNRCTVVTVGSDGKELGSLYFSEEILDTSSAGGYVAVLTANGMDLFDKSMERTASLDTTQGATAVLARPDGTVMLLSGGTGRVFTP